MATEDGVALARSTLAGAGEQGINEALARLKNGRVSELMNVRNYFTEEFQKPDAVKSEVSETTQLFLVVRRAGGACLGNASSCNVTLELPCGLCIDAEQKALAAVASDVNSVASKLSSLVQLQVCALSQIVACCLVLMTSNLVGFSCRHTPCHSWTLK